jgi:signal peptidase II
MRFKKWLVLLATVCGAVALDRFTKYLIVKSMVLYDSISVWGEYIRLTFVYNRGMVFGLKPHEWFPNIPVSSIQTIFMFVAVILTLCYYAFNKDERVPILLGLSLIVGGALGNLHDRFFGGRVVDFIDMGINASLRWPVYNVADSCITVGIVLLLVVGFFAKKKIA